MPSLIDPNFYQTVTCICEHTPEGALGLIINRIFPDLKSDSVFEELGLTLPGPEKSRSIHLGGPVHKGQVFVLHGPPFEWAGFHQVAPSLGLSNSKDILEALAMRRPVVASRVGGIPEIIEDGRTGFFIDPENPTDVAEKVILLLKNPELRRQMGDRGRRFVETHYDNRLMVRRLEDLYRELGERRRS